MKKLSIFALMVVTLSALSSCMDHDDPKLAPIDTTQVKITADVTYSPVSQWQDISEEMTIKVSDVKMSAPKGVVLKSISLTTNSGYSRYTIDEKPFSGETLEFKVPLVNMQGRMTFSLRGNLIKKDSRDAEIMIADNIQKIVFSEQPKFQCNGWLYVSVKGKSSTGEEYSNSFEVTSTDDLAIPVPEDKLYWKPSSGEAPTIEVSLGSGATAWSSNTTFDCKITKTAIGHSSGDQPTLKLTIPNTPGSLNSEKLQLYVISSYFGTWENVTIDPYTLTNVFGIIETQ